MARFPAARVDALVACDTSSARLHDHLQSRVPRKRSFKLFSQDSLIFLGPEMDSKLGHESIAPGPSHISGSRLRDQLSTSKRGSWDNLRCMGAADHCIYCQEPADSREHPLPAAFGEFDGAPFLVDRICTRHNNSLGLQDEQLARCGPEAFFRRLYGVQGRSVHDEVNPFYRGSAGGRRLEMKAWDSKLGIEVLVECENGTYRQQRQLVFVEKTGRTHHLPIREGTTTEQLRAAFHGLAVIQPYDFHLLCDPEERVWVEPLIQETWPRVTFGESSLASTNYSGALGTVVVTNRYFRALAKIGFHYFLTQFPEYTGHEPMFSDIRRFVLDDDKRVERVNAFVGKRQHPLLREMLNPAARPDGWRAHILCAETKHGECLAHVQMFVTEDWPAPAYTVRLASDVTVDALRAAGHAYMYYEDGLKGKFFGEAIRLATTTADVSTPPLAPAIMPA